MKKNKTEKEMDNLSSRSIIEKIFVVKLSLLNTAMKYNTIIPLSVAI